MTLKKKSTNYKILLCLETAGFHIGTFIQLLLTVEVPQIRFFLKVFKKVGGRETVFSSIAITPAIPIQLKNMTHTLPLLNS